MKRERVKKKFHGHFALDLMNRGRLSALIHSSYTAVVFMIGCPEHPWTQEHTDCFLPRYESAIRTLREEALKHGHHIEWNTVFYHVTLAREFGSAPDAWHKEIFRTLGYNGMEDYFIQKLVREQLLNLPLLFVNNNPSNPQFASAADGRDPDRVEYSMVHYTSTAETILHELFHQFGAPDLYYPFTVRTACNKYLPDSIMNGGATIDPLTAFTLGWTHELPRNAVKFLKDTSSVTAESLAKMKAFTKRPTAPPKEVDHNEVAFKTQIKRVEL